MMDAAQWKKRGAAQSRSKDNRNQRIARQVYKAAPRAAKVEFRVLFGDDLDLDAVNHVLGGLNAAPLTVGANTTLSQVLTNPRWLASELPKEDENKMVVFIHNGKFYAARTWQQDLSHTVVTGFRAEVRFPEHFEGVRIVETLEGIMAVILSQLE